MLEHKIIPVILILFLLPSQTPISSSDVNVLNRSVALREFKGTSAEAAASLLREAGVGGGVVSVSDHCDQPPQRVYSLQNGATLRNGLDYISTFDGSRNWNFESGVIVVNQTAAPATLLNTAIPEIGLNFANSLSLSTQQLLQSKEVRDQIRIKHLVELNTPLGFSAVSRNAELHTSPPAQSNRLRGKTLEQALNALATSRGNAVWHYEQFVCDQKSSFRISWLVK
jgi:hypothetical protein